MIVNFLYYACFFLSLSLAIPLDVSFLEDGPSHLLSRQVPPFSTDNIRNCPSAAAVARVQRALNDVVQLSNAASKYGTGRYYSAWFGSNPPAAATSDARIAKRYSQLAAWINSPTKDLFFDCNWNQAGCSRFTIVAYTSKGGSVIVLCQSWWKSPYTSLSSLVPPSPHEPSASLDGYVTTGVQMLHEMTHALFSTDDYILSNGESAYSHKNTLLLAQENVTAARDNADNYAFFALAAYFTRASWSIDPNHLIQGGGDLKRRE